jgi:hypothetical protein
MTAQARRNFRPAAAEDSRTLFPDNDQLPRLLLRFSHLPPVGVGVEAVISDHDLAFIRDVGGHPGDEL